MRKYMQYSTFIMFFDIMSEQPENFGNSIKETMIIEDINKIL